MKTECVYCHLPLDSDQHGIYQYVHGWERKREGGGTNALRLPLREMKWACHACIEERVRGTEKLVPLW